MVVISWFINQLITGGPHPVGHWVFIEDPGTYRCFHMISNAGWRFPYVQGGLKLATRYLSITCLAYPNLNHKHAHNCTYTCRNCITINSRNWGTSLVIQNPNWLPYPNYPSVGCPIISHQLSPLFIDSRPSILLFFYFYFYHVFNTFCPPFKPF